MCVCVCVAPELVYSVTLFFLPPVAVTWQWYWGCRGWFPDFDSHVVACRGKGGRVLGVPCYAIDAAGVGVEGLDEEAVGAPDVYPRV